MRITMANRQNIQSVVTRLRTVIKESDRLSDLVKDGLRRYCDLCCEATTTIQVPYTNQLGESVTGKFGGASMLSVTRSLIDLVLELKYQSIHNRIDTTMALALEVIEEVEGVGSTRACILKAMFDKCDKTDAIGLSIMHEVIEPGLEKYGDKPWDDYTGHTLWKPFTLLNTVEHKYGLERDDSRKIMGDLLKLKLLASNDGRVGDPAIIETELMLRDLSSKTSEPLQLDLNTSGLNEGQMALTNLINTTTAVITNVNAPGGTGKSFWAGRFVDAAMAGGFKVLVCAPTGMASMVLNQFLKDNNVDTEQLVMKTVVTIDRARLLAISGKIEADIIVVDEASMVSVKHLRLLGLIKGIKKIVLLGDISQLQPVDVGSPFRDLCAMLGYQSLTQNMRANNAEHALLLVNVRQNEKAPNDYYIPFASSRYSSKWDVVKENFAKQSAYIEQYASLDKLLNKCVLEDTPVVAHTNAIVNAVSDWYKAFSLQIDTTDYLRGIVAAYFGVTHRTTPPAFSEGMKVYWTADRYDDDRTHGRVYRGYEGTIVGEVARMLATTAEGVQTTVDIDLTTCDRKIMPWFSRTVHKAQGQTMERVLYITKARFGHYDKELHYTALSRAKCQAYSVSLCDPSKVLLLKGSAKRNTLLGGVQ